MVDIWRSQHPETNRYSWFRAKPQIIAERLDFFLVSNCLAPVIINSEIEHGICSDHSLVSVTLQVSKFQRGPGYWRFNSSLLADKDYVNLINELLDEKLKVPHEDNRSKMEFIKYVVKKATIEYLSLKKKGQNNTLQVLERKLNRLQNKVDNNLSEGIFEIKDQVKEIEKIKKDIEEIVDYKTKGAIVCSRVNWHLYGEKSSLYFLRLERYNYTKKNRYRLKKIDGSNQVTTDPKEILQIQFEFYNKLFGTGVSHMDTEPDLQYLNDLNLPQLTQKEKDDLDSPITDSEIVNAIRQMKTNKVGGVDG